MDIYCLKCRKRTGTSNPKAVLKTFVRKKGPRPGSKITRAVLEGTCTNCGKHKTRFISAEELKKGSGFIGNLLGLPGGKVPVLSDLPVIGNIF